MTRRVAVIGGGVAAVSVIHWLRELHPLDKITQFNSENLAPSASFKSTAVAALRGTRQGLSELGDELYSMWQWTDKFYSSLSVAGLTACELETWAYEEKDLKRFQHLEASPLTFLPARRKALKVVREKAWIIDPEDFLQSFSPAHEQIQQLVVKIEKDQRSWLLSTLESTHAFDLVILCTGAWHRWMHGLIASSSLDTLVASQGSYFEWSQMNLGEKSFALSFHGCNLHYRHKAQSLQLGATTIKGIDTFHPCMKSLDKIKNHFLECLELELDFTKAQIYTGIRSIQKSRRPFCGEIAQGLFALNGLYKNGWIFAFPMARKLVQDL